MRTRVKKLSLAISIVIFAGIGYIVLWRVTGEGLPCIFHQITGLYCPGCGTGRMMMSFLGLNFVQAFRYNPAVFVGLPFIVYYLVATAIAYIKGYAKKTGTIETIIIIILFILILGLGALRNIPAFFYLAPSIL